jgi:hypothetical protein
MSQKPFHPAIRLSIEAGGIVVHNLSRRCGRCILPETFPSVGLSSEAVCAYCRDGGGGGGAPAEEVMAEVRALLAAADAARGYDCVALYSGGKDSSVALYALTREMGMRVLAFTLDNGFVSETAFRNMKRITDALGVDHVMYRPARRFMTRIYSVSLQEPFDQETTKYSTSGCGSCISVVLAAGARLAAEKNAPLLAGGWTPGQFTNDALLPGEFLESVCVRHFGPLSARSDDLGRELDRYGKRGSPFPSLFNPLYCRGYDEAQIYNVLGGLGWVRPADTDSCSTNCLLNGFLVLDHLLKYGYHPYEYELAHHVRSGFLPREEALARIARINVSPSALEKIAGELGLEVRAEDYGLNCD